MNFGGTIKIQIQMTAMEDVKIAKERLHIITQINIRINILRPLKMTDLSRIPIVVIRIIMDVTIRLIYEAMSCDGFIFMYHVFVKLFFKNCIKLFSNKLFKF